MQSRNHSGKLRVKVPKCLFPAVRNFYMFAIVKVLPNMVHACIYPWVPQRGSIKKLPISQSGVNSCPMPQVSW